MAINDTLWCGSIGDKLYLQSGQFTSTLKTSEYVGGTEGDLSGISWDGTNTLWTGFATDKLHLTSGQFTSTIITSEDISSIEGIPRGISWDGTNTPWSGGGDFAASKMYLQSGQFSSTLLTSIDVQAVDHSLAEISFDGTDTPWIGAQAVRLYLQSGQFSSTLKTSQAVTSIDNTCKGISWDGTNTPWSGIQADKLYLQSGQFTSTLLTSVSVASIDTAPVGIDTNNINGRLGIIPTTTVFPLAQSLTMAQGSVILPGLPVDVVISSELTISTAMPSIVFVADGSVGLSTLTMSAVSEGIAIIAGVDLSVSVLAQTLGLDITLLSPSIAGAVVLFLPGVSMINLSAALSLHAPGISVTNDIKIVVTNARTFAISEYTSMAYNSMAKFNGKYLYAKADGIYEGGGDNDNGADIAAGYKTGTFDINATEVQKLRNAWLNFRSDGDIKLFSVGNEVNARWYPFVNSTNGTMHERRQKFERGIRDNHFSFGISNVAGSSFEIKTAKILTEPIRKRR